MVLAGDQMSWVLQVTPSLGAYGPVTASLVLQNEIGNLPTLPCLGTEEIRKHKQRAFQSKEHVTLCLESFGGAEGEGEGGIMKP